MLEELNTDTQDIEHIGLTCPTCQPTVTFSDSHRQRIVEHISAHILYDPTVDRSTEPCGLCLRPAPLCKIFLKKTKGRMGNLAIDMKSSSCPNLTKFSLNVAAESTESSPCTNHPIICPHCTSSSPAVWSYTYRQHLLRFHPKVPMQRHRELWTLSPIEKDGMRHIWRLRLKQPKARPRAQRPSLMISETHRARLVIQ